MRECIFPGCDGKHYAKGFCEKHYRRWKRGAGHWKGYLDQETCIACPEKVYAKGLCKNHYQQWQRAQKGHPLRKTIELTWYKDPNRDSDYD